MKKVFATLTMVMFLSMLYAQNVGINNNDPKSALDINGGIRLRPVTTIVSGTSVVLNPNTGNHFLNGTPSGNFTISFSPAAEEGKHTIITNTTLFTGNLFGLLLPTATTVELFFSNGGWKQIGSSQPISNTAWALSGNSATDTSIHFIGTKDDVPLLFKINNKRAGLIDRGDNTAFGYLAMPVPIIDASENTAIGAKALQSLKIGTKNTAVGVSAASSLNAGDNNVAIGQFALTADTVGSESVAVGAYALGLNQNRAGNTAVGSFSLYNNTNTDLGVISATEGLQNTALGHSTLFNNRKGSGNVAIGYQAAYSSTRSTGMVAIGRAALYNFNGLRNSVAIGDSSMFNTLGFGSGGNGNVAIGAKTLFANVNSTANTAIGDFALERNLQEGNTAIGFASLSDNINGAYNTATGFWSLPRNTNGTGNVAMGSRTLYENTTGSQNSAVGAFAAYNNTSGFSNVAIGNFALYSNTSASNLVAIGDSALYFNGTGATSNTAVGSKSLYSNTTGSANTSLGINALFSHNDGDENTAVGSGAMYLHTTGSGNVAIGRWALSSNVGGSNNVAIGSEAGADEKMSGKLYIENSPADKNNALIYGDFSADSLLLNSKTINKFSLNVRGSNALEMGYGTTGKQTDAGKICYGCFGDPAHWLGIVGGGTNNLGNDRVIKLWSEGGLRIKGNAMPDFGSTYTLGNQAAAWRSATTDSVRSNAYMLRNSAMHIVGAAGQLGFRLNSIDVAKINSAGIMPAQDNDIYLGGPTLRFVAVYAVNGMIQTSDARLKTNIAISPYGLKEVMKMQPVQYNWKNNPKNDLQIGFLAQDIQKLIPEAVVEPANGDPMGMKYTELIPVLVKAIQEQQKKIEELEKMVRSLQK